MLWTQPICGWCFQHRHPGVKPVRMDEDLREQEQCCDCGKMTKEGIYDRIDPRTVKYPATER